MKRADKEWFIAKIRPYLMPGEGIRDTSGCVRFYSETGGPNYQGKYLYIYSPTGLVQPQQRAVCHLASVGKGSRYATCETITPVRFGKNYKEQLLEDFMNISGLKGRDLEACRRARTRKRLIVHLCSKTTENALQEAGHTILPNNVCSDTMLKQMRTVHGVVYGDINASAFICGMAFALGKPFYYNDDDENLFELIAELDK
jgi:hypothetical protein